jgi:biopolymer transport protein ExbB
MDPIDLFERGGIAMYPILFCSVAAVTVFFERLWSLRRSKLIPKGFVKKFREQISQGGLAGAVKLCKRRPSAPIARIAQAGIDCRSKGPDMIRYMVSELVDQESVELERHLSVLSTVAYLCPLLGLFGTVSGMIKAFDVISKHTVVDPPLLAAGISEALITTLAGLAVAIPAVVMDRYIYNRVERISLEIEKSSVALTAALTEEPLDAPSLKVVNPPIG